MLHILFACEATAHNVIVYCVSLNLILENTLDKGKRRREGTNAKKAGMISQPSLQKNYVNNGRFPLSPHRLSVAAFSHGSVRHTMVMERHK
jgi:hypothetical protein